MFRHFFSHAIDQVLTKKRRISSLDENGSPESRFSSNDIQEDESITIRQFCETVPSFEVVQLYNNVSSTLTDSPKNNDKIIAPDTSKLDFIPRIIITELSHFDKSVVLQAMIKLSEHISPYVDTEGTKGVSSEASISPIKNSDLGMMENESLIVSKNRDALTEDAVYMEQGIQINECSSIVEDSTTDGKNDPHSRFRRLIHIPSESVSTNGIEGNHQNEEFYVAGGHTATIVAMNRWYGCPDIQKSGCSLLTKVSAGCNLQSLLTASMKVGALETILTAMKNFPNDIDVQREAAYSLRFLCCDQISSFRLVHDLQGLDTVVSAMATFHEDVFVQMATVSILYSLSEYEGLIPNIIAAGGLVALAASIQMLHGYNRQHEYNEIEQYARGTLKRLLYSQQ